jgi:hypothetical protein
MVVIVGVFSFRQVSRGECGFKLHKPTALPKCIQNLVTLCEQAAVFDSQPAKWLLFDLCQAANLVP